MSKLKKDVKFIYSTMNNEKRDIAVQVWWICWAFVLCQRSISGAITLENLLEATRKFPDCPKMSIDDIKFLINCDINHCLFLKKYIDKDHKIIGYRIPSFI